MIWGNTLGKFTQIWFLALSKPWANKATSTKDSLGSISKRKSLLLGSMALEIDFRVNSVYSYIFTNALTLTQNEFKNKPITKA